jgi:hypothetical protein
MHLSPIWGSLMLVIIVENREKLEHDSPSGMETRIYSRAIFVFALPSHWRSVSHLCCVGCEPAPSRMPYDPLLAVPREHRVSGDIPSPGRTPTQEPSRGAFCCFPLEF